MKEVSFLLLLHPEKSALSALHWLGAKRMLQTDNCKDGEAGKGHDTSVCNKSQNYAFTGTFNKMYYYVKLNGKV